MSTAATNIAGQNPEPEPTAISNDKSIAVLPFTNRSNREEDEFFVDGMHDDLLTNLAKIGSLKVISRTSVIRYKDTEIPIPAIAKELGVSTVMEGAVQRAGNTVRINVQLIDAETDEHLWAEIFDRELTTENLFAIQSEISQKIAGALEATLSPQEQQAISNRPTENLEAYKAYLLGRQLMARRSTEDLKNAQEEFKRATDLDPGFALAWVGIAETAGLLGGNTRLSFPETLSIMEDSANKALAINDQLGEAYLSLAEVDYFLERHDQAEVNYRKAIELSPGYATAFQWYSDYLDDFPHRRREALDMLRKAEALDPLSSIIQKEIADQLTLLGQFEVAEIQLKTLLQSDPDFAPAYREMADLMSITGRFDEQVMWLRKASDLDPGNFGVYIAQAFALLDMDDSAALAGIKRHMASVDEQHWTIGWLETLESLQQKNYAAALESAKWVDKQLGNIPQFQNVFGWVHLLNNDYQSARRSFSIAYPKYFDRTTWRSAIELNPSDGCFMAYVMLRSGDEALSEDLVQMTLSYLENELPNYIDHADRYFYEGCYLMKGDLEKVMDLMETSIAHGHHSSWWIWSNLPLFDPLRGTERYEALMHGIRERAASQRANLARMELEAGP
jgi:TolB-like protein